MYIPLCVVLFKCFSMRHTGTLYEDTELSLSNILNNMNYLLNGCFNCGTVWYGMVWHGMVWHGMVWHGMYGMITYYFTY